MSMNILDRRQTEQDTRIEVVSLTDKGPVRDHNEDSIAIVRASGYAALCKGTLLVVADGMGGMARGEVASSMVTSRLPALYFESAILNPAENLVQAIGEVNRRVHEAWGGAGSDTCMGTTVAATAIVNDSLITANVGDSRAYLLHNRSLRQLSRDHSLRQEFFSPFRVDETASFTHVLTQAIGPQPFVAPHLNITRIAEDDVLLLCSDGVTAVLSDAEIKEVLSTSSFADSAQELLAQVYSKEGDDNVSIIVARIGGTS